MIVVSDTSPLRYLILLDQARLIEEIFGHVLIPSAVERELTDTSAPEAVQRWMSKWPSWLEIQPTRPPPPELLRQLDQGEAEAIQMAIDLEADILLIDEFRGRNVATSRGVTVIGVLGVLLESYRQRRIKNNQEPAGDFGTTQSESISPLGPADPRVRRTGGFDWQGP